MLCCSTRGRAAADKAELSRSPRTATAAPDAKQTSLTQHLRTSLMLSVGVTEKQGRRAEAPPARTKAARDSRRPSLLGKLLRREGLAPTDVPSSSVASTWLQSARGRSALLKERLVNAQLGRDRRETTRLLDALHAHKARTQPQLEADLCAIRLGRRGFESQQRKLRRSATVAWEPSDEAIGAAWAALLEAEAMYEAALLKRLGPSPHDDGRLVLGWMLRPSAEQQPQLVRPTPVRAEAYPVGESGGAPSPAAAPPRHQSRGTAAALTAKERQALAVAAAAAATQRPSWAPTSHRLPGELPSPDDDAPRWRTAPATELHLGTGAVRVGFGDDEGEERWPLHG